VLLSRRIGLLWFATYKHLITFNGRHRTLVNLSLGYKNMETENTNWKTYEEVAQHLLNEFSEKFEMSKFEGKQSVKGLKSGTKWEIDAKGVKEGSDIFLIVECRRYTTSRQSQEKIGALAYRIHDTKAAGGIIVSPLGIQEGGRKIAKAENIQEVTLDPNSTTTDYFMQYLNNFFIGISDRIRVTDSVTVIKLDKNGNIVD